MTQDQGQLVPVTGVGVRHPSFLSCEVGEQTWGFLTPLHPAFCEPVTPVTPWMLVPLFIHDNRVTTSWGVHARPVPSNSHSDRE